MGLCSNGGKVMKKNICDRCSVYMKEFIGFNEVCLERVGYSVGGYEELEWKIEKRKYCSRCVKETGLNKSGLLLVSKTLYSAKIRDEEDWKEDAYDVIELKEVDL